MSNDTTANYLRDLGDLIKRAALDARAERDRSTDESLAQFNLGRLTALHDVVSLMQQQAVAFGLDVRDLALDDIDPERDLL
jgi:hypothetical protein